VRRLSADESAGVAGSYRRSRPSPRRGARDEQEDAIPKVTPCLWFDRDAEQAAALYCEVFPRSEIVSVSRYPADTPGGRAGEVMTVNFRLDGQEYVGLNGGPDFTFSEAVSFQIPCADQDEVDHYWDRLTANGGQESQCGWLKDPFGLSWQVVPSRLYELLSDPDPGRAQRATVAMLGMRKIVVAELERAADGVDAHAS
jgi:predicted 3-demethylubiquinone-9 3-methyltransferase (glyoxalase superfamily)